MPIMWATSSQISAQAFGASASRGRAVTTQSLKARVPAIARTGQRSCEPLVRRRVQPDLPAADVARLVERQVHLEELGAKLRADPLERLERPGPHTFVSNSVSASAS